MGHESTLDISEIKNTPWFVYSHEAMPRTDLFMSRDYNADADWIGFNSIHIGAVPEKTWTRIPARSVSRWHRDRADKQGQVYYVFDQEIVKANQERMKPRGVIFLDHEPSEAEKAELALEAEKRNLAFRLQCLQQYEETNKEAESMGRTAKATTYVQECYKVLGMERPGSVEALRAQRQPGEASADRIGMAIERAFEGVLNKLLAQREGNAQTAAAVPAPKPVRTI